MPENPTDKFNWDDIDVGNHVLNHSQQFFAKKHFEHERMDDSVVGMDLLKELDAITFDDKENANFVNTPRSKKSPLKQIQTLMTSNEGNKPEDEKYIKGQRINPVNAKNVQHHSDEEIVDQKTSPAKELQPSAASPINFSDSLIARNRARINPGGNKKISPPKSPLQDTEPATSNAVMLSESLITRNKARINPGVKKEKCATTTTAKILAANAIQTGTITKLTSPQAQPAAPHAYECKNLYKRRKEELLQKQLDEERKKREFHSRPVPNFSACHKSLQMKKVVHAVTMPVTPLVLKKSLETEEKRKQKLEELKKLHPPRFEPRPPTVVYEEPFVPKKMPTVLVPCPFNLRSERRLQERKLYDAAMQRANEEKQKQEEEERRKREEIRIKELRKLTKFKARPNPFK
ncbi:targeting protein for Xklp2 homolog isoform X2 [Eurosta solidaginis]|uniref:targeting protein for Xklp2 homolog isoform X2 n=1 Tax=Eurosta solidaginis TaxID=178769 RepID=UPI003530605B